MATTSATICSWALREINLDPITALDTSSKRSTVCNEFYDQVRREELEKHRWAFAEKAAYLDTISGTPDPDIGYDNYFSFPADCLVVEQVRYNPDYRIIGRQIHTNEDELYILYTQDLSTIATMSNLFHKVLYSAIALAICPSLADEAMIPRLTEQYEEAISYAVLVGAAQRRDQVPDLDDANADWTVRD